MEIGRSHGERPVHTRGSQHQNHVDPSVQRIKKRKQDLEELVRGGTLTEKSKHAENTWNLINRAALMQRFTQSYDDGIAIWTANDASFSQQSASIKREAELLVMLANVITQDGMEDGDDEDYAAYSKQFAKAAQRVSRCDRGR